MASHQILKPVPNFKITMARIYFPTRTQPPQSPFQLTQISNPSPTRASLSPHLNQPKSQGLQSNPAIKCPSLIDASPANSQNHHFNQFIHALFDLQPRKK
jgi:hypothetical protein